MTYRLSDMSAQDMLDIYVTGVREFGTARAEKYYSGLVRMFDFLSENPRAARERPEFAPPVRIHPFGSHVVIYTLEDRGVFIVRVLGGRQDWARYL